MTNSNYNKALSKVEKGVSFGQITTITVVGILAIWILWDNNDLLKFVTAFYFIFFTAACYIMKLILREYSKFDPEVKR